MLLTLVLAINGKEAIWLLADRRLSYRGRPPRDDARKIMCLETVDGNALLGYAGLGATATGREPAEWMASSLRGRNLSLEATLGELSRVSKEQLPRHLRQISYSGFVEHNVVVTAFVGTEVRCYSIDVALGPDRKQHFSRYTRYVSPEGNTPRFTIAGSGITYLLRSHSWKRPLLRIVSAFDEGKVQARTVAQHLAQLNFEVHRNTPNQSVGPDCIVAWRLSGGGGAHKFFKATSHVSTGEMLPTVARGMELDKLVGAIFPNIIETMNALMKGETTPEFDQKEMNEILGKLPTTPDETLR